MQKNKTIILMIIMIFISLLPSIAQSKKIKSQKSLKASSDLVKTKETALKIAEAIWWNVYGDSINKRKPFKAELIKDQVWVVKGTLLKDCDGGNPFIEIIKKDCKVLKIDFGK